MDNSEKRHLVKRMSWNPNWLRVASDRKRFRRNVNTERGSGITIETAVFVDAYLYSHMARTNFPDDTEQEMTHFVLAMINAVIYSLLPSSGSLQSVNHYRATVQKVAYEIFQCSTKRFNSLSGAIAIPRRITKPRNQFPSSTFRNVDKTATRSLTDFGVLIQSHHVQQSQHSRYRPISRSFLVCIS